MPEPVDIPTSFWERLRSDKRRMLAAVLGVLVVSGLLGMFVLRPLLDGSADPDVGVSDGEPVPWDDPSPGTGTTLTPSAEETSTAHGATSAVNGQGASPGESGAGGAAVVPKRAAYIAYRLDGAIWRAREDGSEPVRVADSALGAFALSPDGTVVAVVDGGSLSLHDLTAGSVVRVGAANQAGGLRWFADSSAVLFVRGGSDASADGEVLRVGRRGGGPAFVARGAYPAVTADGTVVVAVGGSATETDRRGLIGVVRPGEEALQLTTRGRVVSLDAAGDRIVYATAGAGSSRTGSGAELWSVGLDGSDERRLLGPPEGTRPFGYGSVCASPDGATVVVAEVGDDGYSRATAVSVADGRTVGLTVRRDTYPVCWTADGSRVFLVEGNAFQGEKTSLVSVRPDGLGRRTVVEGAGL